jgi:transposase
VRKISKIIAEGQDVFVGLEDSKRTWKLNVRVQKRCVARISMPTNYAQLLSYLTEHYPECRIKVIYEAGFQGFWLHDLLMRDGIECVVTPPHTVTEEKNNSVKTDGIDSARLARNLENGDYKACYVPLPKRREDRQISRTLWQVQKDLTRTMNRMRRFLEFHGIDIGIGAGRWGVSTYRKAMAMQMKGAIGVSWSMLTETLKHLQNHKKKLRQALLHLSREEDYKVAVRLYSSVPGIGWFTAIRLALEWGDLKRFKSAKEFSSYLGLVCREDSSGETVRRGRITGMGSRTVRSWLIEGSWIAIGKDPVLRKKFSDVWLHSGSKKKAIVAVARKLAGRLRSLFLSGQEYQLGVVC